MENMENSLGMKAVSLGVTGNFNLLICAMHVRDEFIQVFSEHFLRADCVQNKAVFVPQ